jgi:hypothetical protein
VSLSGPSLDLIAPIRPLQLCADGGYQLRLGVLGVPLIMVPDNFIGFQVKKLQEGTFISQMKYIQDILTKFGMKDAKPINTPMGTNGHLDLDTGGKSVDQKVYRSMIGSLLYLCASRPDIMLSVCMCARFQADPKEVHLRVVKRILRYLVHTPKFGLWYPRGSTFDLIGYSDADWAGCKIDKKSTSGTCQLLGRSLVSWASKKQNSVALSTAEAEYIAAVHCCAQLLWMSEREMCPWAISKYFGDLVSKQVLKCKMVDKVQTKDKGMFLRLSTLFWRLMYCV